MKSGYVAVIGKSNAGKSTLINVLVGEKVSIVSPKPQTTRDRILGVLTKEEYQIVFVDTPGLYKAHNNLSEMMMRTADTSAKGVDVILYVLDGHERVSEEDARLIAKYKKLDVPMLVAFTKTDIMPSEKIPERLLALSQMGVDTDMYPISARKGRGISALEKALVSLLPEGEKCFEEDIVSDRSERFMISEIMREKILLKFDKEIPHGVAVVVHTFRLQENGVYEVSLDIVCEKPNHKSILIGKQGRAIKEVSSFARQDMEKFLGKKVFLTTYIKVKEDWRNRPSLMREFGYDESLE
ncbi:MAG: GTPase Era [Clostridia bacterium]|nr:GTPase Era [Clostridia bacterium]